MTSLVIYNKEMLNKVINQIYLDLDRDKELNVTWEKRYKDKTLRQLGFFWKAIVGSIQDWFLLKGIEYSAEDIKNNFYSAISYMDDRFKRKIRRFNGEEYEVPKRISEMSIEEMSRFIDRALWLCDNAPMFSGLVLHPSIRYCYLNHIEKEDLRNLNRKVPLRDNEYLNYIRKQPCLVCGMYNNTEAHHLRINNKGGTAIKPPDAYCVPLCNQHHLEYHRNGHKWFEGQVKWVLKRVDLEDFCLLNYNRWKNHLG